MTAPTAEQASYLGTLEEVASMIRKTQSNFKKTPKARLTEGYIKARLQCIEEYWQTFHKTHQLLSKCTPREQRGILTYFLNEEFYIYEELFLCTKAEMLDLLSKGHTPPQPQGNESTANNSTYFDASLSCVKLPRIQLPSFSGKYEEFPTFQDLFTSMVHNSATLSNAQKLHYLKTSVNGEAEALLRHIHITDSNYTQAWDLLKSRYGNKRIIVTSLLKRLFYQKKIVNQSAPLIKSLLDTTTECIHSLKNLNISTDSWDPIIVFLVVQRLDIQSHKEWEEHAYDEKADELPKWEELKKFLESKFRTLELIAPMTSTKAKPNTPNSFHTASKKEDKGPRPRATNTDSAAAACVFCNGSHYIFNCKDFSKLSVEERHDFAIKGNLCFNCLIPNHTVFRCKQQTSCRRCRRRHHSLLHLDKEQTNEDEPEPATYHQDQDRNYAMNIQAHYSREEQPGQEVLLATALVNVKSSYGETHALRALIDQGSEASFITTRVVELLGLKKTNIDGTVSGVGGGKQAIKHKVDLQIVSKPNIEVKAYVIKTISSNLPARKIKLNWKEIQRLSLADNSCNIPGKIDMLLGAEVFAKIIDDGLVRLQNDLIAQKTQFGWILSGQTNKQTNSDQVKLTSFFIQEDNDLLRKFWEIENDLTTKKRIFTTEEEECEAIYTKTTTRNEEGRYTVELPLKESIEETLQKVGDTKQRAIIRFKQLERKFEKNQTFKEEYKGVIDEYIQMGHLKKIDNEKSERAIYLPHHAVVREDKETTKMRTVFDASAKGSNGHSLNDSMMVGPVLQSDLRSLIIKWRKHKICVIGDIIKMYRMINMSEKHTNFQCIVWRDNPDESLKDYKLMTVTFGTAAAPFLAVRTLIQLAEDESHNYPEAAAAIKNSFYMDDLMVGHDDVEKAKILCRDIKTVLNNGGFRMQKWSSNSEELLQSIRSEKDKVKDTLEIKLDNIIKILGLTWDRKNDTFKVTVNLPQMKQPVTKRSILSDVARLFDPFGWLAPVVITAKVLIQRLWLCNLGWDDELPADIVEEWIRYRDALTDLQHIQVPRWLQTTPKSKSIQIHGFADASATSYAAVIYLRVVDHHDEVHVTMIASRSKVAPLKQLTIPRLELCAASLLVTLIEDVVDLLNVPNKDVFAYTDSMVVLSWLQSQPNRWRTFVANRVADIQRVLDNTRWSHIRSSENPADVATRGTTPNDLAYHDLWWTGPEWLKGEIEQATRRHSVPATDLEMKNTFHIHTTEGEETPIWERFSTISRMKRVLSYCRRFIQHKDNTQTDYVKPEEMEIILQRCIKYYQNQVYGREIEEIKREGKVKNRSSLVTLSPMIDQNGLLRVGGRLQNANLSEASKHPIIIPAKLHITRLLIQEAHTKTLHGGIQLMMAYVRSRYWVIGLKAAARKYLNTCKTCIIEKAKVKQQMMGQLPSVRVNQGRPFENSGVDYAGPVLIRTSKGRGHHATKGYICLFVCMATKAIHLEAVTDLTAQAFIAAFRRFVARRGPCINLWSDNGTNFVGAAKELRVLFEKGRSNMAREVAELLSNDGTTWHFIPPRMPNYGGLWEAGVQSVKRHLTRVNGTTKLTYEEMSTLLAQIEACLNSRPLCHLDNTVETLTPLTPGHFLVGVPLISVPDVNYEQSNIGLLTRWQMIQKMTQDFWRRWHTEYLNTMQQRYKWNVRVAAPNIGDIVVIKEEALPPNKWLLGRVKAIHPGTDQLVRVVTVQCRGHNELKRPLSKLILLPQESQNV